MKVAGVYPRVLDLLPSDSRICTEALGVYRKVLGLLPSNTLIWMEALEANPKVLDQVQEHTLISMEALEVYPRVLGLLPRKINLISSLLHGAPFTRPPISCLQVRVH